MSFVRAARSAGALVLVATLVSGCSTMSSWWNSAASSTRDLLHVSTSKRPGPLPVFTAKLTPQVVWQGSIGKATPGLAPAVTSDALYVASAEGALTRFDAHTGRVVWRIDTGRRLAGGVGADAGIVVVGTDKGDVLAFDAQGRKAWQAHVSSEVISPPAAAEGIVAVWSGDGRIYGLSAADGSTKWVHQRTNPPLTLRGHAGGVIGRGGLFSGSAGGKLIALDLATGTVGWESSVATPKGATELERIADVTSLPVVGEHRACAVAYQGRIACFDVLRGTLDWSRDISSLAGLTADNRYLYVTDDRGAVQALDQSTGASVWSQNQLAGRFIGAPQIVGDALGVVDAEGILHLLSRDDGALVGRLVTDGTQATTQPARLGDAAVWQSQGGAVYVVTTR